MVYDAQAGCLDHVGLGSVAGTLACALPASWALSHAGSCFKGTQAPSHAGRNAYATLNCTGKSARRRKGGAGTDSREDAGIGGLVLGRGCWLPVLLDELLHGIGAEAFDQHAEDVETLSV